MWKIYWTGKSKNGCEISNYVKYKNLLQTMVKEAGGGAAQ